MKHIYALLIKFIMVTVVLQVILSVFSGLAFTNILYISIAVTVLTYIIGDLLILPVSNNNVATLADAGLTLITIYMFNFLWNIRLIAFSDALISATIIAVGEWFLHKYFTDNVFQKHRKV